MSITNISIFTSAVVIPFNILSCKKIIILAQWSIIVCVCYRRNWCISHFCYKLTTTRRRPCIHLYPYNFHICQLENPRSKHMNNRQKSVPHNLRSIHMKHVHKYLRKNKWSNNDVDRNYQRKTQKANNQIQENKNIKFSSLWMRSE